MLNKTDLNQGHAPSPAVSVDGLLAQCHDLLKELEQFQAFLVERKKEHTVELRQFRNSVTSELRSLERVCKLPLVLLSR